MSDKQFDPASHITKLKGIDYLEVKWRLVWLRTDHPNAVIETEMIEHSDTHAIFKATVDIPLEGGVGGGSATGWGSETKGDFKDFLEKAETKALGRALGALGYGTQFAPDLDDGSATGRVVDYPVNRVASREEVASLARQVLEQRSPARDRSTTRNTIPNGVQATQTNATAKPAQDDVEMVTPGQANVIKKHKGDLGWTDEDMALIVAAHNYTTSKEFTAEQARGLITIMSDPRAADAFIDSLRNPKQAQMIDTSDTAQKARQ